MYRIFILLLLLSFNVFAGNKVDVLRIGLTPVMLNNRLQFLDQWKSYLEQQLKRPVTFIQRKSYQEIVEMFRAGDLDIAWVCGFPFVENEKAMRLLVTPLYKSKPLYQSYFIVNAEDHDTQNITDLKNKVFAYSDSSSNSGYLVPRYELLKQHRDPAHFFSKTFFTWSHADVIKAVAEQLAEGGAVDGYIWDTLTKTRPDLTQKTRIFWKSPDYGFPPLVVQKNIPAQQLKNLQNVFINMQSNPQGKTLLTRLNLDGFTKTTSSLYDSIRNTVKKTQALLHSSAQ